ncbi:MAG: hypothetical protein L3J39_11680 [Verrucomicrobiales bacterium]|nr:hypothetical protein [Verrucomicrobiales bacterium]
MNATFLKRLIAEKQFIDVFDDNAEESFYGYLLAFSENLLHLETYDEEGRFHGSLVIEIEDTSRIRWGGRERDLTEQLISQRQDVSAINLHDMKSAAADISNTYGYICVTMGAYGTDMIYVGEISEDCDDSLILHEYGTRARNERSFLLLRWDDISRVQAGGIYEHNLHTLYSKS